MLHTTTVYPKTLGLLKELKQILFAIGILFAIL